MKTLILLLAAVVATALFTGCSRSHAASQATEPAAASNFKAGAGLELSPAGARFVGLKTAEFSGRLPVDALLRTAKGDFVYVANGGRFLRTPVKVRPATDSSWEILEGLYEGDVVAIAGVRGLWLAELQAVNGGVGCTDGH